MKINIIIKEKKEKKILTISFFFAFLWSSSFIFLDYYYSILKKYLF